VNYTWTKKDRRRKKIEERARARARPSSIYVLFFDRSAFDRFAAAFVE
jgi:hypothetical protein